MEAQMRKVLGLVGAALVSAAPAFAADLAVKAPLMPTGPVFNWTGFYIGGNVGWGWSDDAEVSFSGDPSVIAPLIGRGVYASSFAAYPSGPVGGVQAGYNWQTGPFVLGIETDIQAASIAKNETFTSVIGTTSWITSAGQQLNFLGTVRGRLGYTITPALLVYGSGGFAYGGAEVSSSVTTTINLANPPSCPGFCGNLTSSSTLTGWAAGGGLEYMITPNWLARFDYLYYDLGTLSQSYGDNLGRSPGSFVSTSTNFKGSIARIGASYKF
jgi:outer membrane immunogenic protein